MSLRSRELWELCAVVSIALLLAALLRSHRPLGQDVSESVHSRSVQEDQSSPTAHNAAANLTIIVFTDYRCPACRAGHPAMQRAIEADGKIRIIYKDWPIFGPLSERAALVAIASDRQGIYPAVHDRLMRGPVGNDDHLRSAIELAEGDWGRLERDLARNRNQIVAQLERNRVQAFGLGLGGTPGYLIGPILVKGALNEREFTRVFRQARLRG
jgi:protein-disulfide isomerase